jgi:hypothetical protein
MVKRKTVKAPTDYSKDDKIIWRKFFTNFEPHNVFHVEMAKRYVVWYKAFTTCATAVSSGALVKEHANHTVGSDPNFKNMRDAEFEMRKLWEQLEPLITNPKDKEKGLGQFADT